jgi:glycosyltransferase involved in cell wall biosynthesis
MTGLHVAMLVRNRYTHDSRVEKEARTLTGAGHRVTIVADAGPGLPERDRRPEAEVLRVTRQRTGVPGIRFVLEQRRLARVLRGLRPDVLHAHDSNALVPVAMAARALRVPYLYDAHDLWLGRPRRERSAAYFFLNQIYYTVVERLLVRRAAAVLTVSPPIARHLERRYGVAHVALVPNYPDQIGPIEPRDIRSLTGADMLGPESRVVLYLGGLMAGRGLEELVDAIAALRHVDLVFLGEGVLAGPLRRRAHAAGSARRVHLLSAVPPDQVVSVAASADVGVSPIVPSCLNYRYSLPNKLFQYMAAGLPVVASDFPQVRQIVESARCGLVVDTREPRLIAAAIESVLDDPDAARAMGARGREAVRDRYNWSTSAAALLDVYGRLDAGREQL